MWSIHFARETHRSRPTSTLRDDEVIEHGDGQIAPVVVVQDTERLQPTRTTLLLARHLQTSIVCDSI